MKSQNRLALPFTLAVCFASSLSSSVTAPVLGQESSATASVSTNGGLRIVTFDDVQSRVRVYLPDDLAAGDTISGTVVAEPKGGSDEEREKNKAGLTRLVVDLHGSRVPINAPTFRWTPPVPVPGSPPQRYVIRIVEVLPGKADRSLAEVALEIPLPLGTGRTTQGGAVITPEPKVTFKIPPLGQLGRNVEIIGPFDGDLSNTTLKISSTIGDSEKNREDASADLGLIAESPRKLVFQAPKTITGPVEMTLKEGNVETRGTYRNIGVQLSAAKTNLVKGESTTLTVEVSGLEGIQKDVRLQLDSKGVITMDGGNLQNFRVSPQEVKQNGQYTTTRDITGQQSGGFNVIATVLVNPFDRCLQDDSSPQTLLQWNSFTGDYIFTMPGGAQSPTGQTSVEWFGSGTSGPGKVSIQGCLLVLEQNTPERKLTGRLDNCNKTGSATVEIPSRKLKFTITDRNTADNTCPSP